MILKTAQRFRNGSLKPLDVLHDCLTQIEVRKDLNAFNSVVDKEKLESLAVESTNRWKQGTQKSALDGIPIAVKDNIFVKGEPMTCSSKFLESFVAPFDATAVRLLKEAGCLIVGKTNMDEFGMGSLGIHCAKPTLNPIDPTMYAGGSSSGSACAVKAGMCLAALGSDTGGSVRLPALFCGVTGFKPSYGKISRYGLTAYASSLDCVGFLSNSISDSAALFELLSKEDPNDMSMDLNADMMERESTERKKIRIAVPNEFFPQETNEDLLAEFQSQVERLSKLENVEFYEVNIPSIKHALEAYYLTASSEASSCLARFDGVRYGNNAGSVKESRTNGFGDEVKRRILLGVYISSSERFEEFVPKIKKIRANLREEFEQVFQYCDLVLTPVCHSIPKLNDSIKEEWMNDLYTVPASLAGITSLSIPVGRFGLQLCGAKGFDKQLLELADTLYESIK